MQFFEVTPLSQCGVNDDWPVFGLGGAADIDDGFRHICNAAPTNANDVLFEDFATDMAQSAARSAQAGIGKRDCGISNKQRDTMQCSGCFACNDCSGTWLDQCLYLQLKAFEC